MSYIEKEKLIRADIASIENRVRHAFNQGYDLGFKDGKEKAKPLEQEPSGDNAVSRDVVKKQMIKYGFSAPDMTVTEFVEDLPPVNPKEPTNKNDLGVDCISRADVKAKKIYSHERHEYVVPVAEIDWLPSVTPQEPIEPMVEIDLYSVIRQKYIEREVLDKIRAELHATAEMHEDGDYYLRDEWIDEYFDKYKAETEAKDGNHN